MAQGTTPDGIAWIAAGKPDPDSPSLMFIHGAGANSAAWWQQFEAFSHDRHCIAYDLAGFGASKPTAGTNLRAEMVNAAAEVMAAAGARQAHLVCQSLGGWTGLRLALDRPDLVASLVLSCTLAGIAHGPGLAAFQQAVAKMDERGPASLGLGEEFESAHPLKASLYRQLGALNPQQDPALAQRLFAPDFLVSLSQLKQVVAPTLILAGGDDRIWPPESLTGLSAHFTCAKFTVISKSGHSPYFERPAQFNQAIADFVGST